MVYAGERETQQFQAIPVAPQANDPPGRRDRVGAALCGHRPALDAQARHRRRPAGGGGGPVLRSHGGASPGMAEFQRAGARSAGRCAARGGQPGLQSRPVPAGRVEVGAALDTDRRHSPQRRSLRVAGPLHRGRQWRRQRRCALQRDVAGRGVDVCPVAANARVCVHGPRLRNPDLQRARVSPRRVRRPELRAAALAQRQRRIRHQGPRRMQAQGMERGVVPHPHPRRDRHPDQHRRPQLVPECRGHSAPGAGADLERHPRA